MKNTTLTIVSLALACVGLGMAPATRAGHFSTYLDALQTEVASRLDTTDDVAQKRALTAANKALNRNTKTLSQDLSAFGSAAGALNKEFDSDATITGLQSDAMNNFTGAAEAQLSQVESDAALNTNKWAPAFSNALNQAHANLQNAQTNEDLAAAIRALNAAFAKIHVAQILVAKAIKAPESLDGKTVSINAHESDHESYKFTLASDGTYTIPAHGDEAEESGNWNYNRTSATTGTVTLSGGGSHTIDLKFNNPSHGTIGGTVGADTLKGTFSVKNSD